MALSEFFLVFVKSSLQFNFGLLVSPNDDLSSVKKKAEEQHLAIFPQNGPITAQAFKVMRDGVMYHLPDLIPLKYLFDGVEGTRVLFLDATPVSPNPQPSELRENQVSPQDAAVVGDLSREVGEHPIGEEHVSLEKKSEGKKKRLASKSIGNSSQRLKKKKRGSSDTAVELIEMVPDGLRCHRDNGKGWRCNNEALPNEKYCSQHCKRKEQK